MKDKLLIKRKTWASMLKLFSALNPAYYAFKFENLKLCETLIKLGMDINIPDENGCTLLHYGVVKNNYDLVELLLQNNAYVNKRMTHNVTLIFIASKIGSRKMLQLLLKFHANVNISDAGGWSLLHVVVERNHHRVAELLLEAGATVNKRAECGVTSVCYAAMFSDVRMCELLLDFKANLNIPDNDVQSPLYFAALRNDNKIALLFLENNADPNAITKRHVSALHLSALLGNERLFFSLIEYSCDIRISTENGNEMILLYSIIKKCAKVVEYILTRGNIAKTNLIDFLKLSVFGNDKKIVELLFQYGFWIIDYTRLEKILLAVMKNGHSELFRDILQKLSSADAVISSYYYYSGVLLHYAVKYRQKDIVASLVAAGAKVDEIDCDYRPALFYAVKNSDIEIVRILLPQVDLKLLINIESFHLAVWLGRVEVVKAFLEHGYDQSQKDSIKRAALHYAVHPGLFFFQFPDNQIDEGRAKVAELLIRAGAAQEDQEAAFRGAVLFRHLKVVEIFLRYNAKVNCFLPVNVIPLRSIYLEGPLTVFCKFQTSTCSTPLHVATIRNDLELIKLLLRWGADINCLSDRKNVSPLHLAILSGNMKILKFLLKSGININPKTDGFYMLLLTAFLTGNTDIIMMILEAGADVNILDCDGRSSRFFTCFMSSFSPGYYLSLNEPTVKVVQHLRKLAALGAPLIEAYSDIRFSESGYHLETEDWISFPGKCVEELAAMKGEKIADTDHSFYDLLFFSVNELVACLRNRKLFIALQAGAWKEKYPLYRGMLESKLIVAETKLKIRTKFEAVLFGGFPLLPEICVDKIVGYLNVPEMLRGISAWKLGIVPENQ